MAKFSCFSVLVGRKNKYRVRGKDESHDLAHHKKEMGTLQVKLEHPVKVSDTDALNSTCFRVSVPFGIQESSTCKVKVLSDGSPVGVEAAEAAYEGGDEHDENSSIKREFSDFDLQAQVANKVEETDTPRRNYDFIDAEINDRSGNKSDGDVEVGVDLIRSGHVSDPGIVRAEFWASPILKRSCSNLETSDVVRKIAAQLPPSKCHSFEDLQNFTGRVWQEAAGTRGSPISVMTPCSADRVMLKKHSSSQVLPSRSRRLWWKLFLWSHRNLHKPQTVKPRPPTVSHASNQKGGYCSDTLEIIQATEVGKLESPGSFTRESGIENKQKWDNFHDGVSGSWPENQWVAFSTESSSLTRVDEWVNSLDDQAPIPPNDEDTGYEDGGSPARSVTHTNRHHKLNTSEEVLHANNVIQSLNSSSTVAHITGMSLKVIPTISHLSSLRSVNLSGNFIVRITPGSLPKGLHTLNLSRNKIVAIEGLRELTRLRVLDLSYNRISRIGHGLSNCTLIKELYLAGNKISDVEGLHRLLKLTVLDLSFNKITTAKALGQLVANYNTLLALNVLGNPIQSNIGDDQLRKVVSGLLPQLAYLNKQPIKQQRAREVAMDSVAKAALGNNGWNSRRKARRVGQSGSSSSSVHRSSSMGGRHNSSKHRSKSSGHHYSSTKQRSSVLSSSH